MCLCTSYLLRVYHRDSLQHTNCRTLHIKINLVNKLLLKISIFLTSSILMVGILVPKHLLSMAGINLLVELHSKISEHDVVYF